MLVDDDEQLAQRAARVLRRLGYRDLHVLAGGNAGWKAAGYELYSGVHVPSKAFGEHVEHHDNTPRIAAAELKAKLDAGEDLVVLDSRPMSEYRVMNIPGALDCPGAELVYRAHQAAPRPETLVVVNCAGRTRSIIGAQSLINAGIPNKVVALKNGTMGWHLAGPGTGARPVAHGAGAFGRCPGEGEGGGGKGREALFDSSISLSNELEKLQERNDQNHSTSSTSAPRRSTRPATSPARSRAPGGQLVQATDTYRRGARRAHRARRRPRRARHHDRFLAAADGLAGGVCRRGCGV